MSTSSVTIRFNPAPHVSPEYHREAGYMIAWRQVVGKEAFVSPKSLRDDLGNDTSQSSEDPDKNLTFFHITFAAIDGKSEAALQRAATLSTNFINWLSRNIGQNFLESTTQKIPEGTTERKRQEIFRAEWGVLNDPTEPRSGSRSKDYYQVCLGNMSEDTLTASDMKIIHCMVNWLGSNQGQQFLINAKHITDERNSLVEARSRANTAIERYNQKNADPDYPILS